MADGARVVVVGGGDLLVGIGAAREGHRQGRGALLSVPRKLACPRNYIPKLSVPREFLDRINTHQIRLLHKLFLLHN